MTTNPHSFWHSVSCLIKSKVADKNYVIQIVGIEIPPGLPLNVRNQIRASASNLQASDQLWESAYFESREVSWKLCNLAFIE